MDNKDSRQNSDEEETRSSSEAGDVAELPENDGPIVAQPGRKIHLADISSDSKAGISRDESDKRIDKLRSKLCRLQEALFAEHKRSLLLVIQAMDTAGKDGAIKNLCHGLDPSGFHVTNFKVPSMEEWDHDYLWRVHKATPRKGAIAIWNRSHYEDVLVPRVHKQITLKACRARYEDINAFEKLLTNNATIILKFFLHISKEEQKERLEARLADPKKHWKFNPGDLKERALWDDYQKAYEAAINACTTECAPWHIIPANRKWARNVMILEVVVKTLEALDPEYPRIDFNPAELAVE